MAGILAGSLRSVFCDLAAAAAVLLAVVWCCRCNSVLAQMGVESKGLAVVLMHRVKADAGGRVGADGGVSWHGKRRLCL